MDLKKKNPLFSSVKKKKNILGVNLLQFSRPFLRLCVKGWIQWCLSTTVCDTLRWNSSCGFKTTAWLLAIASSSSSSSTNSSSGWSDGDGEVQKHSNFLLVLILQSGDRGWANGRSYMADKRRWPSCLSRVWRSEYGHREDWRLLSGSPLPLETWTTGNQAEEACWQWDFKENIQYGLHNFWNRTTTSAKHFLHHISRKNLETLCFTLLVNSCFNKVLTHNLRGVKGSNLSNGL